MTFELCYSQHGGSGLNFTRSDVLEMELDEIDHYLETLDRRRNTEADAIKKASKKK